jgi:hypothetical protein
MIKKVPAGTYQLVCRALPMGHATGIQQCWTCVRYLLQSLASAARCHTQRRRIIPPPPPTREPHQPVRQNHCDSLEVTRRNIARFGSHWLSVTGSLGTKQPSRPKQTQQERDICFLVLSMAWGLSGLEHTASLAHCKHRRTCTASHSTGAHKPPAVIIIIISPIQARA